MGTNVFLNRHTKQREEFSIDTEEAVHDIFQNLEVFRDYLRSDNEEKILLDFEYGTSFERGMKHHMMIQTCFELWRIADDDEQWKEYVQILEKHLLNVHEKFIDQFFADVFFYNIWSVVQYQKYEAEWLEDYLK